MIFRGIDNQTVELRILSYQYPDINIPGDYDSNWLRIYVKVQSKLGNWQTVDPALTTGEVRELITWFRDLSEGREVQYPELTFTEPCIAFLLMSNSPAEKIIRIDFWAEMKPKSAKEDQKYFVDCAFTNQELADVSLQLENELKPTPPR